MSEANIRSTPGDLAEVIEAMLGQVVDAVIVVDQNNAINFFNSAAERL